jgi:hypothetical protein
MPRLLVIAAALALATSIGCAQTTASPQSSAPTAASCQALPAALRGCEAITCNEPHPFVRSFTMEHRVAGPDGDRCGYTQRMPGDMSMSCRLSEEGRNEMAAQVEEMARGNLSGGTGRQNAMTRECEVRDSSGTVVPWG